MRTTSLRAKFPNKTAQRAVTACVSHGHWFAPTHTTELGMPVYPVPTALPSDMAAWPSAMVWETLVTARATD